MYFMLIVCKYSAFFLLGNIVIYSRLLLAGVLNPACHLLSCVVRVTLFPQCSVFLHILFTQPNISLRSQLRD